MAVGIPVKGGEVLCPIRIAGRTLLLQRNGCKRLVLVNDSATFTTPEAGDEEMAEDLGGLDDLLASLKLTKTQSFT